MKHRWIVIIRDATGNYRNQYNYRTYKQASGAVKRFKQIDFNLKLKSQYTIYRT